MTPVLSDSRRNSAEAVTWPVRVAASWSWRLLIAAAAVYVLVLFWQQQHCVGPAAAAL